MSYSDVRSLSEVRGEQLGPEWEGLREQAAVEGQLVEVGGELGGRAGEEEVTDESKGKVTVRRGLHLQYMERREHE